jgi:beta-glucosidase
MLKRCHWLYGFDGIRYLTESTGGFMRIAFPHDFVWGASTASYQIEGAVREDGRGASIWDTFSHTPGKVASGHTGDVACAHYHRYREDVALMAELGLDAYRFSVAWPRLFPEGRGRPNPRGRDFYDRLIDALLDAGITPWLCLYHWDLPQALQDKGGWRRRDIVDYFADYAVYVAESYGDRVEHFLMLNEPNVVALFGHLFGIHAPGEQDITAFAAATHHQNLAQGEALVRLRELGAWQLGTVLNLQPVHPETKREEDVHAAQLFDAVWNRNFTEPLFYGCYPEPTQAMLAPYLKDGDLERIRQPIDMLGLNLYTRHLIRADPHSLIGIAQADPPDEARLTAMGWEVYPDALFEQLMELKERYGNPVVYITENGAAFDDRLEGDQVDDRPRIRYFQRYLHAVHRALQQGANVKGYFVWSLLDNFEWAEGYHKRFGIVYVDYATQKRIPKASFGWWQETIREGGFELPDD